MPTSFRESLAKNTVAPTELRLPLCHVAPCGEILNFIEGGTVSTDVECDVFHERLNYFFYGRAAYRPKDGSATNVEIAFPAAIILRPEAVPSPWSVYPFDTGGFPRYQPAAGPCALQEFALETQVAECERIISRHWQSHEDYIQANLDNFIWRNDPNCPAVERYSAIVRDMAADEADDRRSSLEITSSADVPIDAKNIIGLVVPRQYAAADTVKNLPSQGVIVKKYSYKQQLRTGYTSVVIEDSCRMVEEWLSAGGTA